MHNIQEMSDHLENLDIIGLLELQSRVRVRQISSARLVSEWLEPLLPDIHMTERQYKRVLMENSVHAMMFAREVVRRMISGSLDVPGELGSVVFFTRVMNTKFYANESDELIFCVFKNELVYVYHCATGRKVRIMGGAPTFRRMAGNEE